MIKTYIKRTVYVCLFFVGLVLIYRALSYAVIDDLTLRSRVTIENFYRAEDEIDILLIGPSHTLQTMNAERLNNDLDETVYSLATQSQDICGTYFLLKEALQKKTINHVYMELSLSRFTWERSSERASFFITDYIDNPIIRAQMIDELFDIDTYVNAFFPLRRVLDPLKLPEYDEILEIINGKNTEEYRNYLGNFHYIGRGSWYVGDSYEYNGVATFNLFTNNMDRFNETQMVPRQFDYFDQIIKLCKDKGVELSFYVTPYDEMYFMNFPDYEKYLNPIKQTCYDNGCEVIDFNLVKDEYLKLDHAAYSGIDHVNTDYSDPVIDFFELYLEKPDGDYFLNSVNDKYPYREGIVAIAYKRLFASDTDEQKQVSKVDGEVNTLKIDIAAYGYDEIPVWVDLYRASLNETTGEYVPVEEIKPVKRNEFSTLYHLPYDEQQTDYYIRLCDPETKEVLIESVTRFDMS